MEKPPPNKAGSSAHLLGHHFNAQNAILSQEHVGLKRVQLRLAVEAIEVLAERLALQAQRDAAWQDVREG